MLELIFDIFSFQKGIHYVSNLLQIITTSCNSEQLIIQNLLLIEK